MFDPSLSVCNWPYLVPGCGAELDKTEEEAITETNEEVGAISEVDVATEAGSITETEEGIKPGASQVTDISEDKEESSEIFKPKPGSPFSCQEPGFFKNEENCSKFWLCKETKKGSRFLESLLYRCPSGYLFSSPALRCEKEENVSCSPSSSSQDARVVSFTQLQEEDLEEFFKQFT